MSLSSSDGLPDINTNAHDDPTAEGASSSGLSLEIDVRPVLQLGRFGLPG